jgi:hypothetical protein
MYGQRYRIEFISLEECCIQRSGQIDLGFSQRKGAGNGQLLQEVTLIRIKGIPHGFSQKCPQTASECRWIKPIERPHAVALANTEGPGITSDDGISWP